MTRDNYCARYYKGANNASSLIKSNVLKKSTSKLTKFIKMIKSCKNNITRL